VLKNSSVSDVACLTTFSETHACNNVGFGGGKDVYHFGEEYIVYYIV